MRTAIIIFIPHQILQKIPGATRINDVFQYFSPPITNCNAKEFHVFAFDDDWQANALLMGLNHPEFEPVPDNVMLPRFSVHEAQQRYPFLFSETTNPILYRKF